MRRRSFVQPTEHRMRFKWRRSVRLIWCETICFDLLWSCIVCDGVCHEFPHQFDTKQLKRHYTASCALLFVTACDYRVHRSLHSWSFTFRAVFKVRPAGCFHCFPLYLSKTTKWFCWLDYFFFWFVVAPNRSNWVVLWGVDKIILPSIYHSVIFTLNRPESNSIRSNWEWKWMKTTIRDEY